MHLVPEGQVAHGDHRHHDHHAHAARESAPVAPAAAPQEAPAGTIYTCPMHPEVRQDHPGNCPKCGMTLEPIIPLDEEDNSELKDFQRRFWWTLPLTVIVTVLAMWGHRLGLFSMATQTWCCRSRRAVDRLAILRAGWQSIVHRSPNMWTLIGLGTAAAFVYSVVATVTRACFPNRSWRWVASPCTSRPRWSSSR
jgi:Cu+-exporting ATPase